MKKEFLKIKTKLEQLRNEYLDLAKKEFSNAADKIFEKFPELYAFSWNQFTPYFNDGDACTFSVRGYSARVQFKDDEDLVSSDEQDLSEEQEEATDLVTEMLDCFPDEMFLDLFGDHATVTFRRGKEPEVEEYYHD